MVRYKPVIGSIMDEDRQKDAARNVLREARKKAKASILVGPLPVERALKLVLTRVVPCRLSRTGFTATAKAFGRNRTDPTLETNTYTYFWRLLQSWKLAWNFLERENNMIFASLALMLGIAAGQTGGDICENIWLEQNPGQDLCRAPGTEPPPPPGGGGTGDLGPTDPRVNPPPAPPSDNP